MAFRKSPGLDAGQPSAGGFARSCTGACAQVLSAASRVVLSVFVIALLSAGLLCLRLMQGPLEMPGLGSYIAQEMNASSAHVRVSTGTMTLRLGDGRVPAGLEFRDVVVDSVDGNRLFQVPRLSTQLRLSDLIHGQVRPVRISVIEADAQFIRAPDGRIRFGLGQNAGIALGDAEGKAGTSAEGLDAINTLLDTLIGDGAEIAELAELNRIEIIGANLSYQDRRDGGTWSTRDADLRITRQSDGALAILQVDDIRSGTPGASLRVAARRQRGTGMTRAAVNFGRLDTDELARQLPALGWLAAFGATMEGAMRVDIRPDGKAENLSGELIAERGMIRVPEGDMPFDQISARFRLNPTTGGLTVDHGRLSAGWLEAEIAGHARLDRTAPDKTPGVSAQIDLLALMVDRPEMFDGPLSFDNGQMTLRWQPEQGKVRLADGWLAEDDLIFRLNGQITQGPDGPITDLRAEAPRMTKDQLIAHWPKEASKNAREWIRDHVDRAEMEALTAELRLGAGPPRLAMRFGFDGLQARPIKSMSAIQDARGDAHVTLDDLHMHFRAAHVDPAKGLRLDLAGSDVIINDFEGEVTPADVRIRARGSTRAVMALIDQDPLRLVSKLGLELGAIDGQAAITAQLDFPLINALRVADVGATATARLSAFRTAFSLSDTRAIDVRADRLNLTANTQRMTLTGRTTLDGAPVSLDWREDYGTKPGRRLVLSGTINERLMAQLGAEDVPFSGQGQFDLTLTQAGEADPTFAFDANLAQAQLELEPLDWRKPVGRQARLKASGTLGDAPRIDTIALNAAGLEAVGRIDLGPDGDIRGAQFSRIRMPGVMDVAADIKMADDKAPEIFLTGDFLNVADQIDSEGSDGPVAGQAYRLRLGLKRLVISEKLALIPANGRLSRDTKGSVSGKITGNLAGRAPVSLELDLPAEGQGGLVLSSNNAGEALRAADLYEDARGGTLFLKAQLGQGSGPDLTGQVRIENVRVRSDDTFKQVLRSGGLEEAEEIVTNEGISFRKIWVPFTYDSGVVTLTDAIAVSPVVGLKVNGTLNEQSEQLDMVGVVSPAYALTGALNNVPLLGEILAGGEGEGIVAMTFTLSGQINDPDFSVNPLSILAPGFLRRVFTSRGGDGAPRSGDNALVNQSGADR